MARQVKFVCDVCKSSDGGDDDVFVFPVSLSVDGVKNKARDICVECLTESIKCAAEKAASIGTELSVSVIVSSGAGTVFTPRQVGRVKRMIDGGGGEQ